MKKIWLYTATLLLFACKGSQQQFDAQGTFEADEVIVSAEIPGRITALHITEGDTLQTGTIIGTIDATNLTLQKAQVEASIEALQAKTADVQPQVQYLLDQKKVQQTQLNNLQYEQERITKLLAKDAATRKQLDDILYQINIVQQQIKVTEQQIAVQRNNVATQNRSILSEASPLAKRAAQIDDQITRANITAPISGTVLTKYATTGEVTSTGKGLFKMADVSSLFLRAYVTSDQLSKLKLGQTVTVWTDKGKDAYQEHKGIITWISDKAEFTPKTIQTKEERAHLVYAIKIKVPNNGYLKIGMYADVTFQ